MFYINWELTLIVLIPVPVLIISTVLFKRAIKTAFIEVRKNVAKINTFIQEHVTGMSIVQIFNREDAEYVKFVEINKFYMLALGFLGALIWVPHLLCLFFLLGDGFGFSLKTHHLMIVLCLSNIPVGLMRDGS